MSYRKTTVSVGQPNRGMITAVINLPSQQHKTRILQVSVFYVAHSDLFLPIILGVEGHCFICSHCDTQTLGRTCLHGGSARRRDLYLTTQNLQ